MFYLASTYYLNLNMFLIFKFEYKIKID